LRTLEEEEEKNRSHVKLAGLSVPYCYHYYPLIHIIAMSVWEGSFGQKTCQWEGSRSCFFRVAGVKISSTPSIHVYVLLHYYHH
jgi:hypothetical protein